MTLPSCDPNQSPGEDDMAKAKEIHSETVEQAIRRAIDQIPGIRCISEEVYCQVVADACDIIKVGAEERLREIDRDKSREE